MDGLRREPEQLIFSVIAGVPQDLTPAAGQPPRWEPMISEDSERDPRMQTRIDPDRPAFLLASCPTPERGYAVPPIRLLRTARRLEAVGARVSVGSICGESLQDAMDALVWQIGHGIH